MKQEHAFISGGRPEITEKRAARQRGESGDEAGVKAVTTHWFAVIALACSVWTAAQTQVAAQQQQAALATSPTKVVTVNIQAAIAACAEGKKSSEGLTKRFASKKADLDQKAKEIQDLESKLQQGEKIPSEEQKSQLARDIERKKRDFKSANDDSTAEYQQALDQIVNVIGSKMLQVIKAYSQKNGYDLMLNSSNAGQVLFQTAGVDVTNDIVLAYDMTIGADGSGLAASQTSPSGGPSAPPGVDRVSARGDKTEVPPVADPRDTSPVKALAEVVIAVQQGPLQELLQEGLLLGLKDQKDKSIFISPLRELVVHSPNDYDANYFLGYLLLDLGKPAEAIGPLKVAAALHPEFRWSYTVLAEAYGKLGDQETAISLMEASLQRPKAHFASGRDEDLASTRYFDTFIWGFQVAKQYHYYIVTGQEAKASGLLAAYDPMFRSTILREMRTSSPLDMHDGGVKILAEAAIADMKTGDTQGALDLFLNALELEPDNEALLYGVASMSFELHRYGDAIWAYQSAADLGQNLNSGSLVRLGISHLVLGDYLSAYQAFDRAHAADRLDSNIRRWRIAAAFGVGGWKLALDTLIAMPPLDPAPDNRNQTRLMTYDIVYGTIKDADDRAISVGLHYPRLGHLSLLHELLTEVVQWGGFGNPDKSALEHEKWQIAWQTAQLYRALRLKPLPPKRALEQEMFAEQAIRENKVDYPAFRAAVAETTIAPWWPEAHYNLAIYARDYYFSNNLKYDDETYTSNKRIAAQEFILYLRLAPQGAKAILACRQLKDWGIQCSTD